MSQKSVKEKKVDVNPVIEWAETEAKRLGITPQKVIEQTFSDGFLTFVFETAKDEQLTAWTSPKDTEEIGEFRRLRKEFAPIARGIEYIKSIIIGSNIDVKIDDPEDTFQKEIKEYCQNFLRTIYQDSLTQSLYTILSIMLDEALTVGASGAILEYANPVSFDAFAKAKGKTKKLGKDGKEKEFTYYATDEPKWTDLEGIRQIKILRDAVNRMELYRDPASWDTNYWTLDENTPAKTLETMATLKKTVSKEVIRLHTWQVLWLAPNRLDWDEKTSSVITPVKKLAQQLERILNAVGEGVYRAGNKKYFIVCGTEKRPWGKPYIRNVMQQIKEMGKQNWTTVPVPSGFDIKEIGGQVFDATDTINAFLTLIAEGMHVPQEVIGLPARGAGERQFTTSFNEIERMRYEFHNSVINQLIKRHIWCKYDKTRLKQGGKAYGPTYIPSLKTTSKGLMNPIERLTQIMSLLNVANPVDPMIGLELNRDIAEILGFDDVKLKSQDEMKKFLKEMEQSMMEKGKTALKSQGAPSPQTEARQENRLQGGVNKRLQTRGQSKPMGGPRLPVEASGKIGETTEEVIEESTPEPQRVEIIIKNETKPQEIILKTETEPQEIIIKNETNPIETPPPQQINVKVDKLEFEKLISDFEKTLNTLSTQEKERIDNVVKITDSIASKQLEMTEQQKKLDEDTSTRKRKMTEMKIAKVVKEIEVLDKEKAKIEEEVRQIQETHKKKQELIQSIRDEVEKDD